MPDPNTKYRYFSTRGKEEQRCKYCSKAYSTNRGTRVIQRHLLKKYTKTKKSSRENISAKRQRSIKHALKLSKNQSFKRQKLNTTNSNSNLLDSSHLKVLYIKFLTACYLLLRLVECPEFRDLLNYINDDINTWLPTSYTTITHQVLR